MKIYSVKDKEFAPYGRVVEAPFIGELLEVLKNTPQPDAGVSYVPVDEALRTLPAAEKVKEHLYGGLPVQLGWCNGKNTKLNCLEYHRSSEFNLGTEDFILLLARQDEIVDGVLDTTKVKAFRVPAGTMVEVYATTLHYAPCHTDEQKGFRVLVALPAGTNTEKPKFPPSCDEDRLLWACNKWLLAHAESSEAAAGAYLGLAGENIDLKSDL